MRKTRFIYHLTNAAVFIILEIAALNMLSNNGTLQGAWFSKGSQALMRSVWGGTQRLKDYFSLKKSNETLALENFRLRERVADLEHLVADSIRTARLKPDGISGNYRYIPASIEKISNNTQHNYIIIDKGYEDGVVEGDGIITEKGAIGVIDAVSRTYSYARSFRNHEMSISSRLGRQGSVGPLSWDGHSDNMSILREIPLHVEFQKGDTVFTSGYSSIFPPDIPLGVTGDSKIVNGATYEIEVTLFENFRALRYVTVVENLGKEEMKELEDTQ